MGFKPLEQAPDLRVDKALVRETAESSQLSPSGRSGCRRHMCGLVPTQKTDRSLQIADLSKPDF